MRLFSCPIVIVMIVAMLYIFAVSMVNDSSALSVKYRGVSGYYVCSDQWTSAFSDAVCQQLGHA